MRGLVPLGAAASRARELRAAPGVARSALQWRARRSALRAGAEPVPAWRPHAATALHRLALARQRVNLARLDLPGVASATCASVLPRPARPSAVTRSGRGSSRPASRSAAGVANNAAMRAVAAARVAPTRDRPRRGPPARLTSAAMRVGSFAPAAGRPAFAPQPTLGRVRRRTCRCVASAICASDSAFGELAGELAPAPRRDSRAAAARSRAGSGACAMGGVVLARVALAGRRARRRSTPPAAGPRRPLRQLPSVDAAWHPGHAAPLP